MRLTSNDHLSILDAIGILNSDTEPETMPVRTDAAVRSLVPTDIVSFEGFGSDNDYFGPLWFTPEASVSHELLGVMAQLVDSHPIVKTIGYAGVRDSLRTTDVTSIGKFRETPIYKEFFEQIGTDMQLTAGLVVHRELWITVSLCRLRKDFTDRDCGVIDLLAPHLVSAFRTAQFVRRMRSESEELEAALEIAKYGIITLDWDLKVRMENRTGASMLKKYFHAEPSSLPDELKRYVQHHQSIFDRNELYLPAKPFVVSLGGSSLRISVSFNANLRSTTLLLEEIRPDAIATNLTSSLTRREFEVLRCVGQGKTDSEIAVLLDISVRTVQKHIEHIFDKLGVETRTAAAMIAFGNKTK